MSTDKARDSKGDNQVHPEAIGPSLFQSLSWKQKRGAGGSCSRETYTGRKTPSSGPGVNKLVRVTRSI